MTFLIGGANSLTGGFDIDNSLRFNKADSPKLNFTQGTPTSRRTWTYSTWVKRGNLKDQSESILSWGDEDFFDIRFQDGTPDDGLLVYISDGDSKTLATNRLFRDPATWYHIIVASDTTDGTAGDRTRIYVNGVEETSFAAEAQPDQNYDYRGLVSGDTICIGNRYTGSHYLDGYLADTHFIDGQQLTPSSFGETNDNGVWIPIEYDGSYGTNGFKLEYKQTGTSQNSSGIGADTSGNDNHFAVTNLAAVDVTTDTPTNNFCTGNPLDVSGVDNPGDVCTFSEGNTKIVQAGSNNVVGWKASTIGIRNGKWYFELKLPIIDYQVFGVGASTWDGQDGAADNQFSVYIDNGTETFRRGAGVAAAALSVTSSNNDIWMFALDLDSPKLWIGHQGTWLASGDPAAGSNPMSTQAITDTIFIGGSLYTQNDSQILLNTGNPPYANSSSQADDNGYGDFEYDVPAGFYSICTKNLATYG